MADIGAATITIDVLQIAEVSRVVKAAVRKVEADDAVFLAGTGKIGSDFDTLRQQAMDADHELQAAVRELTKKEG